MKIKQIKERLERNEDAISRLEAREDMDFWDKQGKIVWHQSRILHWLIKLREETK